jgi:hypothetical protein
MKNPFKEDPNILKDHSATPRTGGGVERDMEIREWIRRHPKDAQKYGLPDPNLYLYGTSCPSCSKPMSSNALSCSYCSTLNSKSRQEEMIRKREEETRKKEQEHQEWLKEYEKREAEGKRRHEEWLKTPEGQQWLKNPRSISSSSSSSSSYGGHGPGFGLGGGSGCR